jgi:hypothetical protein
MKFNSVAASRQRAALLIEMCGGLPTAATFESVKICEIRVNNHLSVSVFRAARTFCDGL